MSNLKPEIYIYKYIEVKKIIFLHQVKNSGLPAVEAFNCISHGNVTSEWVKRKKRFQYYVAAAT